MDREGHPQVANTLGNYNPAFYANTALIWLSKALGLGNRVYRGFDEERKTFGKGDTINIRRPSTFTAASAPATAADLNTTTVAITLDQWKEVKFKLSDKEMAYTGERIVQEHIAPAAYALADNVDTALATLCAQVPHAVFGSTAATVADISSVRKELFDNKVPMRDESKLHFMIGGAEESDLNQIAAFSQHQGAASAGVSTQMTGQLGQRYGLNFFANQNRPTITYAARTDDAGALTANAALGATSIAVDGLGTSEVISAGTILTFDGTGESYATAADVTMAAGAGTLTLTEGLRQAEDNNDTFAIPAAQDNDTHDLNLAFHSNFAGLAFARLPDFAEYDNSLGAQVFSVQDPVTGLAVRARIYYVGNSSEMHVALDTLYGYKLLDGNLACRYELD
ncbi:MAG: hypothetical protein VW405_00180 [Rhodospirillaceae bacterium]